MHSYRGFGAGLPFLVRLSEVDAMLNPDAVRYVDNLLAQRG
jgi:hypothetical protein